MPIIQFRSFAVFAMSLAATAAFPAVVRVGYEQGLDQEAVALLAARGDSSVLLQRLFLEPRKARVNPARASTDTLQVFDTAIAQSSNVLSYKADAPLWVGAPQLSADGVVFAVRAGTDPLAAFKYTFAERAVRRLALPWERTTAASRSQDFERAFLLSDGVIAVRSVRDVQVAEVWIGDSGTPITLDLAVQNGDGRVISVEDVAEVDGRVLLAMLVSSGEARDTAEAWLLNFDRSFSRAKANAVRLDSGTIAAGKMRWVRSMQGVSAVSLVQRSTRYGQPTLKLFPVAGGRQLWTHQMPRLLGADELSVVGVCRRSFVVVRNSEEERLRTAEVETVLVGPLGQEQVIERTRMPEGTSAIRALALADRQNIWSLVNFSRMETARRDDGWYSWRGYQASTDAVARYCKFE